MGGHAWTVPLWGQWVATDTHGPASLCGVYTLCIDNTAVGSTGGHRHPWASIPMWGLYSVYWQHCCGVNGWPPTPMGQHPYVGFILCVLTTLLWGQQVAISSQGPASPCVVLGYALTSWVSTPVGVLGYALAPWIMPVGGLGVCIDIMGQYPCRGLGVCIGTMDYHPCGGLGVCISTMDHACWGLGVCISSCVLAPPEIRVFMTANAVT